MLRVKIDQRPIAFIAFCNHVAAVGIPMCVHAEDWHLRPHVVGWIQGSTPENVSRHRGSGCLPVGSGNDDALFLLKNCGQSLRAAHTEDTLSQRGIVGHITFFDS